jgi:hypothetical protein
MLLDYLLLTSFIMSKIHLIFQSELYDYLFLLVRFLKYSTHTHISIKHCLTFIILIFKCSLWICWLDLFYVAHLSQRKYSYLGMRRCVYFLEWFIIKYPSKHLIKNKFKNKLVYSLSQHTHTHTHTHTQDVPLKIEPTMTVCLCSSEKWVSHKTE